MNRYLALEIENEQPLKIANVDKSKPGEMETLNYIPGSTIRGMVISVLAEQMKNEHTKKEILSKIYFYNGYPMVALQKDENLEWKETIPSPKGFYENKLQDGTLENVITKGMFSEGSKRAALGNFCYMEGNTIFYTSMLKRDNLNICVEQKNIFRENVLVSGQKFRSYIAISEKEEELMKLVKESLDKRKEIYIGSGKTSGFGKCKIKVQEIDCPYESVQAVDDDTTIVYMYLLSNMSMRNEYGEICGIDQAQLGKLLGVSGSLKLEECATSVCKMSGINRTWGCRTPEITMYEAGSVFKITAKEPISVKKLLELQENGLGVRKQEGCGRVLFLKHYEQWDRKENIQVCNRNEQEVSYLNKQDIDCVMKIAAKEIGKKRIARGMERYIAQNTIAKEIPKSQRGIMLNLAKNAKYRRSESIKYINEYIQHEKEKIEHYKQQNTKNKGKESAIDFLEKMIEEHIFTKLGIEKEMQTICNIPVKELFTEEELVSYRFELLEKMICFENKKEG